MKKLIVILLTLLSVMAAGLTAFAASTGNLQVPQGGIGSNVPAAKATALICRNQAFCATAAQNFVSAGNIVSSAAAYCPNNNICITQHVSAAPVASAPRASRSYSTASSSVSQPATASSVSQPATASYVSQPVTSYVSQPETVYVTQPTTTYVTQPTTTYATQAGSGNYNYGSGYGYHHSEGDGHGYHGGGHH